MPWLVERPLQSPSRRPDSKPGTSMMLLNWLPPRQAGNDIGEILTTCISHFNPEIIWALEHTGRLIMAAPVVSTSNQIPSLQNDRIQLPPGWCRRPNSSGPRDSRGSQHLAPSLTARPPRPFRGVLGDDLATRRRRDPLSHEALDQEPDGLRAEHMRSLLAHHKLNPNRDTTSPSFDGGHSVKLEDQAAINARTELSLEDRV